MNARARCVLIVVQNMSFSYDTRVQNIAHTLVAAGYRVRVLCPRYRRDPQSAEVDGVHVRFIRWPELGPGLVAHLVEYVCSVVALSLHVLREVVREDVEIVHVCNPPDLFFGVTAVLRLARRAVVFDQHDSWPELFAARGSPAILCRIAALCTRATITVAHRTLLTSEGARAAALARGADPATTFVVHNGIRLDAVPPATTETRNLVGYLGNMNPQDGLDELLEVARTIRHDHGRPDVRFLLIGDGTSWPAIRAKVLSLGLEESVTLAGRLPPEEAWRRLAACAVCIQPDPPNAFTEISVMAKSLEYMALGKAIAAFDLAETRSVCGDAALYAPGADPRALGDCVLALLEDAGSRADLGRRGRQRVGDAFTWTVAERELLDVYARLPVSQRRLHRAHDHRFLPGSRGHQP
jgi:glycosyltransferase involved in cell wall biosynthesis